MPKVSVIIPIYNAQVYLERCLDSVCNQTLKDIEIICVNDASTDKSIDILNKYAQSYQNMKVIDCKINGGESVARNIGMENATGEYLGFVDNDDEIDVDFYEKLYNKATEKNADISKGEVHIVDYDQKETYGNLNKKIRENNEILFFAYHWWTAIFKTSIIKDNHIEFIPKYPLGGDVLFLNKVVLASNSIALVDDAFYHYYRRENSGDSKILTFEKIKSVLDIHEMIVDNILSYRSFNKLSLNGINHIFAWCLQASLTYCYRRKTIEALDYSIHKAITIYTKIEPYLPKDKIKLLPICKDALINKEAEKLKSLFIENSTSQKMFLANLRYIHVKQGKTFA